VSENGSQVANGKRKGDIARKPAPDILVEPVYNIEVDGDHVYRVGEQGLLVHNASVPNNCCTLFPGPNLPYLPTETIIGGPYNGRRRATGVKAILDSTNVTSGTPAGAYDPPGWLFGINPPGQASRVARAHLLGDQLGGSGTDPRNIVPLCQSPQNSPRMRSIEDAVRRRVNMNETVYYEVEVTYASVRDAVPAYVTIQVMSEMSNGMCWSLGPRTIANPSDLRNC